MTFAIIGCCKFNNRILSRHGKNEKQVGSDDWNIFAMIPGCEEGPSPTPTPPPPPKLHWEITVDEAEYSPGDYVHLTLRFTNEGEDPVLITNPITTTFIAD